MRVPRCKCQTSNQSGICLTDVIRKLQDRGYRFKLSLNDMTLSYFDSSQGWYVCAGRGTDIGTLVVPFGAFIKGSRLSIKARSILRGHPDIQAYSVNIDRFNTIQPATAIDSKDDLAVKECKQEAEGISKTSTMSSFNPTCSL